MPPQESHRLINNNFDLLRLLFAGTVCLTHLYELSGFQELRWIVGILSSEVAVKAFFVVSGFLIFMSYERSSTVASYAGRRFRRIYPAYFTVVMLCALGLVLVSAKPVGDYFSSAWVRYLFSNLAFLNFLQLTLPGVFEANKLSTVNGALWTLKIEVMFYMAVPFLVLFFTRFGRIPVLVLAYCSSVVYAAVLAYLGERTGSGFYAELGRQLPGQLSYFMAGAFLYYYLPLFERRVGYFLAAAIFVLAANKVYPLPLFEPLALAIMVVFFGLFLYVGNFGKYGDFSYGLYIVHFPIIQLYLHTGWFLGKPRHFFIAVVLTATAAAIALWHLVEKRFLLRSSHYVATTASPAIPPGRYSGSGMSSAG